MSTVDPAAFHATVYEIARMIPHGMVTSYGESLLPKEGHKDGFLIKLTCTGHLARLAGSPAHSRLVGQAMKFLQADDVPWQRVISSSGAISDRGDGGEGARRQAERLREEGVDVSQSGTPVRYKVSLAQYGWFPDHVYLGPQQDEQED